MKYLILGLITAIMFTGCVSKNSNSGRVNVSIIKTYKGMISAGYDEDFNVRKLEPLVIKTEEDYDNFISLIPEFEMTPVSPAPKSDDPLLKKPDIDFTKEMILVIFSYDVNTFIPCEITAVTIQNNVMKVDAEYADPDEVDSVQKIIDYGLYFAVVVPLFNGEVIYNLDTGMT
ncbi:MAG: hypothetical protein JXJ04_24570 [Spirochaetales bacterium]|nr:hypothetical protein [Spirochaetales bacterium]